MTMVDNEDYFDMLEYGLATLTIVMQSVSLILYFWYHNAVDGNLC